MRVRHGGPVEIQQLHIKRARLLCQILLTNDSLATQSFESSNREDALLGLVPFIQMESAQSRYDRNFASTDLVADEAESERVLVALDGRVGKAGDRVIRNFY